MTIPPFAHALMRKSERALESARVDLRHGDPDGAVNRAYYAMFNAARASLLTAGLSEADLPRTHHGVIAAFGQRAVQTQRVDPALGRSFNEAEVLRLKADYTGFEIGRKAAEEVVSRAEVFVRTVEREFGLESSVHESNVAVDQSSTGSQDKAVDLPDRPGESAELMQTRPSSEEMRRRARENWLKNYYHKRRDASQAPLPSNPKQRGAQEEQGKSQPESDSGLDHDVE